MSVIFFLIPLSIVVASGFLVAFIWAVRSGQYDDTCTPALRLLVEDKTALPPGTQHKPARSAPGTAPSGCPLNSEFHKTKTS